MYTYTYTHICIHIYTYIYIYMLYVRASPFIKPARREGRSLL